jgi:hypothetical protein
MMGIGLDPQRRLPEVDPDNREALLSIGAFTENLALAAGTYGLHAEMEIIAANPFQLKIFAFRLTAIAPSRSWFAGLDSATRMPSATATA